jgi:hypothetical protein
MLTPRRRHLDAICPVVNKGAWACENSKSDRPKQDISSFRGSDHPDRFGNTPTNPCGLGLNVLAFILIFFLVPETAGAMLGTEQGSLNYISLEELNYIFGVRTRKHMKYQIKTVVPWAWKYYVRRRPRDRKESSPELLYTWVRIQEETQQQQRQ